jgi:hypothetical protein
VDKLLRAEPLVAPPPGLAERVARAAAASSPAARPGRELWKIAAAAAAVLGLSAYSWTAWQDELSAQARWIGVVQSGVDSARNLIEGALQR